MSEMTERIESPVKDAAILVIITLVAALLLAFVHEITLEPIAKQEEAMKTKAYAEVYPGLSGNQASEKLKAEAESFTGADGVTIDEALLAKGESGTVDGLLMTVTTTTGYGAEMTLTVGYREDGTLTGISFLTLNETAGLGMKAQDAPFRDQFTNKSTKSFSLYKGNAEVIPGETRVDAISNATITSKAVTSAVNNAIQFAGEVLENGLEGYLQ